MKNYNVIPSPTTLLPVSATVITRLVRVIHFFAFSPFLDMKALQIPIDRPDKPGDDGYSDEKILADLSATAMIAANAMVLQLQNFRKKTVDKR